MQLSDNVKKASAIISLIVAIGGTVWAMEEHYVDKNEAITSFEQLQKNNFIMQYDFYQQQEKILIRQLDKNPNDQEIKHDLERAREIQKDLRQQIYK